MLGGLRQGREGKNKGTAERAKKVYQCNPEFL